MRTNLPPIESGTDSAAKTKLFFDEYGQEQPVEEFINMALTWCPDGLIGNAEYHETQQEKNPNYWYTVSTCDKVIDGLRVSSSTEFS